MDLDVYTSALETRIQQMLSQVYHVARYRARISCDLTVRPGSQASCEFFIWNLTPRNGPANLEWGVDLYSRVRAFPSTNRKVSFNFSRSHWSLERYSSGYTWDHTAAPGEQRRDNTWANLELNHGLGATIEGWFESPAEASQNVTVKLQWMFQAEGGEPETPELQALITMAVPMILPLHHPAILQAQIGAEVGE
jgi:hypothetical protein